MSAAWTPPTTVTGGQGLPGPKYEDEVVGNLQYLHDGYPFVVAECQDISQNLLPQSANRAFAIPVVPRCVVTLAGLTYRSDTTSGNIDVGVYIDNDDGTASRLQSSGSVAMPGGASSHTVDFTASQVLDPFTKYWFAIAFSATGARVLGTDGPYSLLCKQMDSALPLPDTFTFASLSNGIAPCLVGLAS